MSHIDPETELLYMPSNWVVRVPPEQSVPLHVQVYKHSLLLLVSCYSPIYKLQVLQSQIYCVQEFVFTKLNFLGLVSYSYNSGFYYSRI